MTVARFISMIVGVFVVFGLFASTAQAASVPVADLIDDGDSYDGQVVVVSGELVGDYGFRSDGWMWTQLNGDSYGASPVAEGGELSGSNLGIGVRMPADLAVGLDAPGRYRTVGPVVEVTGVWRYHDPSRQGETYLEVSSLTVVAGGRSLHENPDWVSIVIGAIMAIAAATIARSYKKRRSG